ncbi:unnamed protein product [Anisakis simplex]|uniref:Uracil-DNA glycosylase n=1 Tax=Anisakis simplex TaxID=6269 RepID=A0A0M3JSR7_ANISI|nr:unnamed protein product [Anisakis simplex]
MSSSCGALKIPEMFLRAAARKKAASTSNESIAHISHVEGASDSVNVASGAVENGVDKKERSTDGLNDETRVTDENDKQIATDLNSKITTSLNHSDENSSRWIVSLIIGFNEQQISLSNISDVSLSFPVAPTQKASVDHLKSLLTDSGWRRALDMELRKEYMHKIVRFLEGEREKGITVYPPRELIFNAFNLTPLSEIRVVIIGQDPYHNEKQAHGLCFSVAKGVRPPPSLVNIYKEMKEDIPKFTIPNHGCLESWARQGVFMLNATLTVEAHKANSHSAIGWQKFTDEVIRIVSRNRNGVVFLLWGGFAHKKEALVDRKKHTIIKTAHPSPLSARLFMGCRCFSKTNNALIKLGKPAIDWASL